MPLARPLAATLATLALLASATPPHPEVPHPTLDTPTFERDLAPLLTTYCLDCHALPDAEADLDLSAVTTPALAATRAEDLAWVALRLEDGDMPPSTAPRPTPDERRRALAYLTTLGDLPALRAGAARTPPALGPRRLARRELVHALADLTGTTLPADALLPPDDHALSFDQLTGSQTFSDAHLERWLDALDALARRALPDPADPAHPLTITAEHFEGGDGNRRAKERWVHFSNGTIRATVDFRRPGDYLLRAHAYGQQAGDDPPRMDVLVDRERKERFDVRATEDAPGAYDLRTHVDAGPHELALAFTNDYYRAETEDGPKRDRNLITLALEVTGPLDPPVPTRFESELLAGEPDARELARRLAPRAWRRPPSADELDRLAALVPPDAALHERARRVLVAVLAAPQFLFRVERPRARTAADADLPAGARPLDDHALATRLATLLWSSVPDDALLARAARDELRAPAALRAEVDRMLRDARATRFVEGFLGPWLRLGELDAAAPDPARFPDFDDALRASMRAETLAFLEAVLREDRPLWELLAADFGFVDARLAALYGIEGVEGAHLRRVRMPAPERGGLLGMASVLTLTSFPTRTSPVLRGKWVLEVLRGETAPPPPPNVPALADGAHAKEGASVREQLAAHLSDASCAACHARMDPLGFGLESFDALGALRASDGGRPVDAAGTLPDGTAFRGPAELAAALRAEGRLPRALLRALFTYALGRPPVERDEAALDAVLAELDPERPTLRGLLHGLVSSPAFRALPAEDEAEEVALPGPTERVTTKEERG